MNRAEIRWYTFRLPDKRRPVLLLTRNEVIDPLNEIIVVPLTRTIRGLTTEVILTRDDGMLVACAVNFDHAALTQRTRIVIRWLLEAKYYRRVPMIEPSDFRTTRMALSHGVGHIPVLGFGTLIPDAAAVSATRDALQAGILTLRLCGTIPQRR